ncbi:N-acetylmuramoyl-L-alanine amidase [Catenulispora sp. NL8]|uniref:N-acetylmuramoyl-L-alanine amidase n=1 Tax=Catenulispora pinistramenti TaxID=2705254 RepID=A0ABS5L3A3_9ACTN|nr:peptidoglycan-binding protein [Catenulispora pinistramenti]MBS2552823.1 N-acetylmuramoyl-L-alanine amidase [Catenulispora pinistramenti]
MPHLDRSVSRRTALRAGVGATAAAGLGLLPQLAAPASASANANASANAGGADLSFVIDCADWGARPPSSPVLMQVGTTRKIIVHHMEFPNVTDYSRAQAIRLAQQCQNLHMDHNGWIDTGQHFTVSRGGYVLEGRHRSLEALTAGTEQVQGAHCIGENSQGIGIENEGTYFTETPPEVQFQSLTHLCIAICRQYGLTANHIFGHWDYNDTDCPGRAFYREFPTLRRNVAQCLGQTDFPDRTWPDVYDGNAGPVVRVVQWLLMNQGYAVTTTDGFDAATVAAIQDLQGKLGVIVASDGTVTDPTWEALGVPLRQGDSGNAVQALQSILVNKGYTLTQSGDFDHDTHKAVQDMQRLHWLEPTGKVDTDTWCATVGGIVADEFA